MNDSHKLDEILTRIKAVEKTVNPPLWRQIISWILSHILFLCILSIIAYFTWKTWLVIDHLQTSFDALKTSMSDNTNAIGTSLESGFEKIKDLKFWE